MFSHCSFAILLLFCRDLNDDNWLLTTVLLSEGWVPETSRSFHYWQPAPRWRLLPWLENPGNPAMSPNTGKGIRHPSHWINSGKREGRGGENCLDDELALLTMLQVHTQSTCRNTSNEEHMEFQFMCICKKPLTTRECQCSLFATPLNCISLHLIFTYAKQNYVLLVKYCNLISDRNKCFIISNIA